MNKWWYLFIAVAVAGLPWYAYQLAKHFEAGKVVGRFLALKNQLKEDVHDDEEQK